MRLLFPTILFIFLISFIVFIALKKFDVDFESLFSSKEQVAESYEYMENLEIPFGIRSDEVIHHKAYTLSYNELHEQANWVAYFLTAERVDGSFSRTDDFREDPLILSGSAQIEDYQYSGFDRGHLAPAGDMKWSEEAMSESFYMSNMSPQEPEFNRDVWRMLEEYIRERVLTDKLLYITTGPVLHADLPSIGSNEVTVPEYFYKVLLDYTEPEIKAVGFIIRNTKADKSFNEFAVSIDSVETFTGIDFYPLLPDSIEMIIEAETDFSVWFDN